MDKPKLNDCKSCDKPVTVPILDYVNGKYFLRCPHCRSNNGWMAESVEEAYVNWNKATQSPQEEYGDDEDYPFDVRGG